MSQSLRKSVLNINWKDWCWSWNSSTLATWYEELTHWKRPWCWERLKAGEWDGRGWHCWMASPTRWTWVWVGSRSWWWTGKPGVLQSMVSQRVRHDWVTELNCNQMFMAQNGFPYKFQIRAPWSVCWYTCLSCGKRECSYDAQVWHLCIWFGSLLHCHRHCLIYFRTLISKVKTMLH